MSATTTIRPKLLQLLAEQDIDGQVTATLQVRWCVHPDLIDELKEKGFEDPQLLLVVRRPNDLPDRAWFDTDRYIVPLTQELTFVNFKRAGTNQITAAIVDGKKSKGNEYFEHEVFGRSKGKFEEDITTSAGKFFPEISRVDVFNVSATLEVSVPQEMFAKEPSPRLKRLVQRFFKGKADDQCHFRKRAIAGVILTPFLVVFGTIFKVATLMAALLYGLRKPAVKELLKPFDGELMGVWNNSEHSSYWFHETWGDGGGYGYRDFPQILLNPYTFLVPPTLFWLVGHIHKHGKPISDWSWWHCFVVVNIWLISATLIILATFGIAMLCIKLLEKIRDDPKTKARHEARKAKKTQDRLTRRELTFRELEQMTCGAAPVTADVKALRHDKQTVGLRFRQLKARVCKPYAT